MHPVANLLQRSRFTVVFEDLKLEYLNDSLSKVGEIVIDVLVTEFGLEVVLPFTNYEDMIDVFDGNL
jgi:hypothetical protein